MSKVTIRHIAERANVSQAAVSLALHGKKGISEQTRESILAAAQELGYQMQRRVDQQHLNSVILLVSETDGPLQLSTLQALTGFVLHDGGQLCIHTLAQLENNPHLLASCRLLITFDTLSQAVLDRLAANVPRILVLDGDYPRAPFWNLRIDYSGAAYALTKHLSSLGHRSFIYWNADLPMSKSLLCFKGFQRLILELRLPLDPVQIVMDLDSTPNVLHHFPDIIQSNNISAIVCTSARAALRLKAKLNKMNLRVPQDVSIAAIVGGGAIDGERDLLQEFSLTHVDLNFARFGSQAAQLAAQAPKGDFGDLLVPCSPVISGGSIAAPKYDPANRTLALALYQKDHPTLRMARAGFLNMTQQMGYQAKVAAISGEDEEEYCRICQSLAQQDIAGAVVWLNIPKAIGYFKQAGIPVVCLHNVTRRTPPCGWQAGVAADPFKIAESVAGFFAAHLRGKTGRLTISQSGHNPLEDSIAEELTRLVQEKCPQITVSRDLFFAFHTDESASRVTDFVRRTPDLLGAFSTAGSAAITWALAKKALNRSDMIVVGTDYDEDSIALINSGELDAFVAQPIYEESQNGVLALDTILRGKGFPSFTTLDAPLVTKQNVKKYDQQLQYIKNWYV